MSEKEEIKFGMEYPYRLISNIINSKYGFPNPKPLCTLNTKQIMEKFIYGEDDPKAFADICKEVICSL